MLYTSFFFYTSYGVKFTKKLNLTNKIYKHNPASNLKNFLHYIQMFQDVQL